MCNFPLDIKIVQFFTAVAILKNSHRSVNPLCKKGDKYPLFFVPFILMVFLGSKRCNY